MERQRRRTKEQAAADPPRPDSGDRGVPEPDAATAVQVTWGAMVQEHEVQGLTVGEVYRLLQAPWNIAPGVHALVNGRAVPENHVLGAADRLEFTRAAGEKGSA